MDRLIAISLLVQLGISAAIASALVRSKEFKTLLFNRSRTTRQTIYLVIWIGLPFALGVLVRLSTPNFIAADLSFEASILTGMVGGPFAGLLGGVLVGVPALFWHEWIALPVCVLSGVVAGAMRQMAPSEEDVWTFTPFVDLSIYRWLRRNFPRPTVDWQIAFFTMIVVLRMFRLVMHRWMPLRLFAFDSASWLLLVGIFAVSVMAVAIPLKIWNNARIELKLEEQNRMLLHARMEALQSQINPHFLFNTLNSVSSLVRFDPDTARGVIIKLANILRRLLRKGDNFVQLREELEFIDDYLDIEVVRFGRDKLRVVKELDPESMEVVVPAMLLQPLVENSIKHGLGPKIDGGTIHLRTRVSDGRLTIEVQDDGVGMGAAQFLQPPSGVGGSGIGMANVADRLNVFYGDTARLTMEAVAEGGTLVRITVPLVQPYQAGYSVASAYSEARSSTSR